MASSDSGMVNGRSARQGLRGKPTVRKFTYNPGTAATGDVYGIIPVFKDETLVDLKVIWDDLAATDSGSTVGDSLDPDRFAVAADVSVATAGSIDWATDCATFDTLHGSYTFTQDDTIDVTMGNLTTGAAGDITVIATLV